MKIIKFIHYLSFFSLLYVLSFNSEGLFGSYFRPYVVAALLFLGASSVRLIAIRDKVYISKYDIFPILFLCYALLIGVFLINEKTVIYLTAYFFTIAVYLCVRISVPLLPLHRLLAHNCIAVSAVSIFVLTEFIAAVIFELRLRDFFPAFVTKREAEMFGVPRAYGLSEEPTTLGSYLLPFGGLAILYSFREKKFRFLVSALVSGALVLTLSASALAAILGSFIILFSLSIFKFFILRKWKLIGILISIVSLLTALLIVFYNLSDAFKTLLEKIVGLGNAGDDRFLFWSSILYAIIKNSFQPHGIGSASLDDILIVNWYLMITYEFGLIGLIIVSFWFLSLGFEINKLTISPVVKFFLIFLFLASVIQLCANSQFYFPFLFVYAAIIMNFPQYIQVAQVQRSLT
jgi:hypothetical protein